VYWYSLQIDRLRRSFEQEVWHDLLRKQSNVLVERSDGMIHVDVKHRNTELIRRIQADTSHRLTNCKLSNMGGHEGSSLVLTWSDVTMAWHHLIHSHRCCLHVHLRNPGWP
jgi:hypothetical protein